MVMGLVATGRPSDQDSTCTEHGDNGIARDGDVAIITSDPDEIRRLLSELDVEARVVQV